MKKILIMIMVCALLLVGCSDTEGDTSSHVASSTLEELQSVQSDQSEQISHSAPNYSPYSSLIFAYEKATNPYPHNKGTLYANLVDFNGDSVFELVLARIYDDENVHSTNPDNENYIGDFPTSCIQIFALDENGGVRHEGEFPLTMDYGQDGLIFRTEYLKHDELTYLITGTNESTADFGGIHKTYWAYENRSFEEKHTVSLLHYYEDAESNVFLIDGEEVSVDEFTQWWEGRQVHTVLNDGYDTDTAEITAKTKEFLEDYPNTNNSGQSAVFKDAYYVILEDTPQSSEEQFVVDFHHAFTFNDAEEKERIVGKNADESLVFKSSLPGTIIEDFEVLSIDEISEHSIALKQSINESIEVADLNDPVVVFSNIQSVTDMDIVQYMGQYGQSSREWYVIDRHTDGTLTLELTVTDNHFMGRADNAFDVAFIGDYDEVFSAYGYEIPVFDLALTEKEQDSIDYFGTENGSEYYLIGSKLGMPIQVYETSLNSTGEYVRGNLLFGTENDILYLLCNVSELHAEVEIVTTGYGDEEYSYYPFVSLLDGRTELGDYAEGFNLLENTIVTTPPPIELQTSIAMLNKTYHGDFGAGYATAEEYRFNAVFESGDAFFDGEEPLMLLKLNEPVPEDYYTHPYDYTYTLVENYKSKGEIIEAFVPYFTDNYIETMQSSLDENFIEFEGNLYIAHGGLEYGTQNVDLNAVDYSLMQDNSLAISARFHSSYYGEMLVTFVEEDGVLKIDSDRYILMYPLHYLDGKFDTVHIPDFRAFASGNELPTPYDHFTSTRAGTYEVMYDSNYHDNLTEYVKLLKILGFTDTSDGDESVFNFEKPKGDYTTMITIYTADGEGGLRIEIDSK